MRVSEFLEREPQAVMMVRPTDGSVRGATVTGGKLHSVLKCSDGFTATLGCEKINLDHRGQLIDPDGRQLLFDLSAFSFNSE